MKMRQRKITRKRRNFSYSSLLWVLQLHLEVKIKLKVGVEFNLIYFFIHRVWP